MLGALLIATLAAWIAIPYLPETLKWFLVVLIYGFCAVPIWHYVPLSMRTPLIICIFTLEVTLLYNHVGQLVPQKIVYPPKDVVLSDSMTTEEMVEIGRELVAGKGTCLTCHNTSARFPRLDDVGAHAGSRRPGYSDVDYLAESLYEPNAFVLQPFAPGMLSATMLGLNRQEVLAIIAYLQSLGGKPSVTMQTALKFDGGAAASGTPPQAAAAQGGGAASGPVTGEQLVAKFGCTACHSLKDGTRLLGPSLFDVGKRLSGAEIYQAVVEPDAKVAEGFPPGVMTATLNQNGFFDQVTTKQLKEIVAYLSSLKG